MCRLFIVIAPFFAGMVLLLLFCGAPFKHSAQPLSIFASIVHGHNILTDKGFFQQG